MGPQGRARCSVPGAVDSRAVDLIVRNARLFDGRLVDLAAENGRWTRIGESLAAGGADEIDTEGRLATSPLVDCHLHLDASLTAGKPRWNESGTLIEGINVWGELKSSLTEQDVFERAYEVVRWSVAQGTLYIRAHADVSGENEAMVRGLLRLRDEVADLCTIQVTAFPQDGIFARGGDDERLENALRLGVDCVGGIPHYEPTSELGMREVHRVFELAKQYARRIDVHCDETDDPSSRFLEVMADDTVKFGLGGRVDVYPKRRGFAQLKELLAAGVNVSLGNDVIMDPWYLMGRADMVEAASLALHFTYMSGLEEIPEMLRCATERGARTLGVEDEYGIEEGKAADLVVFDAPTPLEVMRLLPPRRRRARRCSASR